MSRSTDPFERYGRVDLTEWQHEAVSRWMRAAADQLALRDWRIILSAYQCTAEAIAEAWVADESDTAWIAVENGFLKAGEEWCRASLTHEVLHCHIQRLVRMHEQLVEKELGNRTEAVIEMAGRITMEQVVDRLAWAVSRFLPALPAELFDAR